MRTLKHKNAFTLLEVIFAIVILGIVASIGASIIAQVYESYIMQRSIHNASFKSELAIQSITNRLSYRIDKSMMARKPSATNLVIGTDVYPMQALPADQIDTFTALEWIGYENDGFSAYKKSKRKSGWSGFVDLNQSDFTKIVSIGSNMKFEKHILNNLYQSKNSAAVMFLGTPTFREEPDGTLHDYSTTCMHQQNGCMFPVTLAKNKLTFDPTTTSRHNGEMKYTEFYKLAASAYAVVPEEGKILDGVNVWNLYLYSNYQPWEGENYTNGTKTLLARNVSVFRFSKETNSVRIKLCSTEAIGDGAHISICKEKAAIR
jgi:prepilin-type N-terminal cleavage/methylation domain-containing protein